MTNKISIMNPLFDKRWDHFAGNHKDSTIYHHSLWCNLLQNTFNHSSLYFICEDKNGEITAGLPFFYVNSSFTGRRLVSIPFADHCDPLIENKEQFYCILQEVFNVSNKMKVNYIEFRVKNNTEYFKLPKTYPKTYPADKYINHYLPLNHVKGQELSISLESLKNSFQKSQVKRNINKAIRSKLEIVRVGTEEELKSLNNIMVLSRRRHGLPPHPYRFFKNLWSIFGSKKMVDMFLAIEETRPVAAIILGKFKDTMYYMYGGSDYRYLKNRPNHLLLWRGIERACEGGLKYFDFGRSSPDNVGLLNFKRGWATKEKDIHHYINSAKEKSFLLVNRGNSKHGHIRKMISRTPMPVLKFIGNIIYKHLG